MIQYVVSGSYVKYKNADDIDIHSWEETFYDGAPIVARQNAISYYQNVIESIKEGGDTVEDITYTGDHFTDLGLGIRIYVEVIDPFDKSWDQVELPHPDSETILGLTSLGSNLEEVLQEWISEGHIETIEEFKRQYDENEFRWTILEVGGGVFTIQPQDLLLNLENEIAVYDQLDYSKNNSEVVISLYNSSEKQIKQHNILWIPFNWEEYNHEIQNQGEVQSKLDKNAAKYLDIIKKGEGKQTEFKSTLQFSIKDDNKNDNNVKLAIAKTIAGFLNTKGGLLFVGVNDNGEIKGLEHDYQHFDRENKRDAIRLALNNIINEHLGKECNNYIDAAIYSYQGNDFMVIIVDEASFPVTLSDGKSKKFYVRGVVGTESLDIDQVIKWVMDKFKN